MERSYTSEVQKEEGTEVRVAGWVRDIRDLGKIKFLIIGDREGEIQVTVKEDVAPEDILEKISELSRESVVSATGKVKVNDQAPGGREIMPTDLEILSESEKPLPLDPRGKQRANLATRLDNRFLDLRREEKRAIFRVRDVATSAARRYFEENGFIEIHTPKITISGTEGGAEVFPIIYYEDEAFLVQSAQLYKQLLQAAGFEKVYEITPQWRAEKSRTPRHLTESWSIDMEMSFIEGKEDVMVVQEEVVAAMIKAVRERCQKELETLDVEIEIPELPLPRLTYDEALEIAREAGEEVEWGEDLNVQTTRKVAEKMEGKGHKLYFITGWPSADKAFYYQPQLEDMEKTNTFDLNQGSWEISSGGQRIHDIELLKQRIRDEGMDPDNMQFYLDAFRYGIPPHGGFGFGIDRFVASLLDIKNIKEAVLFPRTPDRLVP